MILIDAEKLKLAIRDDPEIDGQNFARMKMHIEEAAVAYKLSPTDKWIPVTDQQKPKDRKCYFIAYVFGNSDMHFFLEKQCITHTDQMDLLRDHILVVKV